MSSKRSPYTSASSSSAMAEQIAGTSDVSSPAKRPRAAEYVAESTDYGESEASPGRTVVDSEAPPLPALVPPAELSALASLAPAPPPESPVSSVSVPLTRDDVVSALTKIVAAGVPVPTFDAAADAIVAAAAAESPPLFPGAPAEHTATVDWDALEQLQLSTSLIHFVIKAPSYIWPLLWDPERAAARPDLRVDDALHNPIVRRFLFRHLRWKTNCRANERLRCNARLPPVCVVTVRAVFPAGRDLPRDFPRVPRMKRDPALDSDTTPAEDA